MAHLNKLLFRKGHYVASLFV